MGISIFTSEDIEGVLNGQATTLLTRVERAGEWTSFDAGCLLTLVATAVSLRTEPKVVLSALDAYRQRQDVDRMARGDG